MLFPKFAAANALNHADSRSDSIHSTEPAINRISQGPRGMALILILLCMLLVSGEGQLFAQQAPSSSMRPNMAVELDQSATTEELGPPLTVRFKMHYNLHAR